jgi:tetratricopeptide (TPR) repeat protein
MCACAAIALLHAPALSTSAYWHDEAASALDTRDQFVASVGLPSGNRHGLVSQAAWDALGQKLLAVPDTLSPWHAFFSGMLLTNSRASGVQNDESQRYGATYFDRSLSLCQEHPGDLWVLMCEFHAFGQNIWVDSCVRQIDKLFISSGAQASPLLAQPLMRFAMEAVKAGDNRRALTYFDWASSFDRNMGWGSLRKALLGFPATAGRTSLGIAEIGDLFEDSWVFNVGVADHALHWLTLFLSFVVAGLIAGFGLRHLPRGLHPFVHCYPQPLRVRLKQGYTFVVFGSLAFFGVIPFLWVVLFLIWRDLARPERIVVGVCAVFLACAPLVCRAHDIFGQPRLPGTTLQLFEEALDEGYSPPLDRKVQAQLVKSPSDYLAHVSAALVALKKPDPVVARAYIDKAEQLNPNDPVVLLTSANIAHFSDDFPKANERFKKCMQLFPELEASFFNPCVYYFGEMKFIEGINLVTSASKLNPRKVSSFIGKNDDYFSSEWPRLRYFLLPDYKSEYFFKNVLPKYWGSWTTADRLWGMSFLGIPVFASFILSIVLLLALFALSSARGGSAQFLCKLCGLPICRDCKRGDLCLDCHDLTAELTNHPVGQHVRTRILLRRRKWHVILAGVLDMVFPGVGTVWRSSRTSAVGIVLTVATSLVYSVFAFAATARFWYPWYVVQDLVMPLSATLGLYCAAMAVRSALWTMKNLRK